MKPGDLVECLSKYSPCMMPEGLSPGIEKGEVLTIREIRHCKRGIGLCFEEKINPICTLENNGEYCYNIKDFRKLDIPPLIEEEIEECLNRELVLAE